MKYAAGSNFHCSHFNTPTGVVQQVRNNLYPLVICAKLITDRDEENIYLWTNYLNFS